ncbi:Vacuolar protein sorting-associated protein 27 [Phytophthora nicotianae]|uniref:Vacuolar protein sorting-associated protein 27 n=1 Tax=Phytophthora nicotianae TaxID=4792 RepID=A0A0W8DG01_PHYNI|nr:Vacuolar protein sorting-associated protein 27 [Phytophthora nicotianae]
MVTKSKNPMVATTAGAIAGGIEILTIWPMEMIKTNLQLGTMRAQYTGMVGGFRYHIQTDGVGSLYRGLAPVLVGSIPKAGIRFGAFDFIKRRLEDENGKTSAMRNLAAGMMAGSIEATFTTTPIETLKTKLIGANAGMWEGTKMILAKEGIRGIYQGLWATILKQSTNQGLRFMWFSEFQKRVNPEFLERHGIISDAQNMTGSQRASLSLIGGMTAGIFSVFGNNHEFGHAMRYKLEAQTGSEKFSHFYNMDQTSIYIDMNPKTTITFRGERDVDVVQVHKMGIVRERLQQAMTDVEFIPADATGLAQPMDVSVMRVFKHACRELYVQHHTTHDFSENANERRRLITKIVEEAWRVVPPDTIRRGFVKAGLIPIGPRTKDGKLVLVFKKNRGWLCVCGGGGGQFRKFGCPSPFTSRLHQIRWLQEFRVVR